MIAPKPFDRDFKLNAVQRMTQQGKSTSQVARDLGISPKTMHG
ncbi:transposase [Ferroacidibacillus organovorans]|uniref:Transposase n=1 Tax=Ferroacidibacillus organovorans TaxID=1765683 RepID=A0A1V4EYE1_9BACL|nr:hypothetical protein B2M26_00510 [Ferroacidibacillus organovorans]